MGAQPGESTSSIKPTAISDIEPSGMPGVSSTSKAAVTKSIDPTAADAAKDAQRLARHHEDEAYKQRYVNNLLYRNQMGGFRVVGSADHLQTSSPLKLSSEDSDFEFKDGRYRRDGGACDVVVTTDPQTKKKVFTPMREEGETLSRWLNIQVNFKKAFGETMDLIKASGATSVVIDWDPKGKPSYDKIRQLMELANSKNLAIEFGPTVQNWLDNMKGQRRYDQIMGMYERFNQNAAEAHAAQAPEREKAFVAADTNLLNHAKLAVDKVDRVTTKGLDHEMEEIAVALDRVERLQKDAEVRVSRLEKSLSDVKHANNDVVPEEFLGEHGATIDAVFTEGRKKLDQTLSAAIDNLKLRQEALKVVIAAMNSGAPPTKSPESVEVERLEAELKKSPTREEEASLNDKLKLAKEKEQTQAKEVAGPTKQKANEEKLGGLVKEYDANEKRIAAAEAKRDELALKKASIDEDLKSVAPAPVPTSTPGGP